MEKDNVRTINQAHFRIRAHCDISGEKGLSSLWIEIPDFCQLQCSYCFANTCRNTPKLDKDHLRVDEYLRLLDDFKACGGMFLGIPGNGEPFHPGNRDLILKILHHADSIGLRTTVFTTGETIFWDMQDGKTYDENIAKDPDFGLMDELAKLDVILLIKCNSLVPKTQDLLVSQPGYTKAREKALRWLMEEYQLNADDQNRRLGIVTSLMPENKEEIIDLFHYAQSKNLIFDCDTILPRGRGKKFIRAGHALSDQECRAIYQSLDRISGGQFVSGGSYVGIACDRVMHHLYVDIRGDAFTCIGCVERGQDLILGNIRNLSLQQIWNHPIRVQMRDNLDEIVLGPCSYCENFQVSCWSCLGRSVERFEIKDGKLFLHTHGCFNHMPDWDRWLFQCDRLVRTWISEVPSEIREELRERIHQDGLDLFWQELPQAMVKTPQCPQDPTGHKDIRFSDLNISMRRVWEWISLKDGAHTKNYHLALATLLPRILLCSLKLIFESSLIQRRDKAFTPAPWSEGTVQFTNLMFYLPQKEGYIYRTVVQNSFDSGILDSEEYRTLKHESSVEWESIRRELRIRNRMALLWQRWAEAFRDQERAPIIPHIKNLSQILEGKNVDTYELILTEALYRSECLEIDCDVRHNEQDILAVFPILDMPMIKTRVARMHDIVRRIAEDEQAWEEIYSIIPNFSFVNSWNTKGRELAQIEKTYQKLAKVGFCPVLADDVPKRSRSDFETQVRTALSGILRANLILFPDSLEKGWLKDPIPSCLESSDSADLLRTLSGPERSENKRRQALPKFVSVSRKADLDVLSTRIYNPLLVNLMRLFLNDEIRDGSLCSDWPKAVNYFIWLNFFREFLGIQAYFVHHTHNLRRNLGILLKDQKIYATPSGIIVCSHDRLSSRSKNDYRKAFTQVMSPLEVLVKTEFLSGNLASKELQMQEAHKIAEARKMALGHYGHTLKNRLDVLNAFLEKQGTPAIKMRKEMLRDLTLILQLNTLDNRKELLERLPLRKQERFLDIEGGEGVEEQLDVLQRIQDWRQLVGGKRSFLIIDPERGIHEEKEIESELIIGSELEYAVIGLHLEALTQAGKKRSRLKEVIYRELIFELLNNIMRYGAYEAIYAPRKNGKYHIRVWANIYLDIISFQGCEKRLLVICNEIQSGKASDPFISGAKKSGGWLRWPEAKRYDGPGMSVDLLRRLELGDMFYGVEDIQGHPVFRVGLHFEGLELEMMPNRKEDGT